MTIPRHHRGSSAQAVATPVEFIRAVLGYLGEEKFIIDLAADTSNTVAEAFFTEEDDSLEQDWDVFEGGGWCWLNPPFSNIKPWVRKAAASRANIALLVPASVGANWWREWVHGKADVLFLNGRIKFTGHQTPYPKDLALLLYTPRHHSGYNIWNWRGKGD